MKINWINYILISQTELVLIKAENSLISYFIIFSHS